jgi:hypothetical protein
VFNAAVGGADIGDLLHTASAIPVAANDVVVASIETNDAAPWKQTPLAAFKHALEQLQRSFDLRRWVYVTPPGVDEIRLIGTGNRSNRVIGLYRNEAMLTFRSTGSAIVGSHEVADLLGGQAFEADDVHLTAAAYRLLLPEIEGAVASAVSRDP